MLFSKRNGNHRNAGPAVTELLSQYAYLEQRAAEICFRRNVIISHNERRGVMDVVALSYLAQYGVSALGKDRAAAIAHNLELSGTCVGLADCILSL